MNNETLQLTKSLICPRKRTNLRSQSKKAQITFFVSTFFVGMEKPPSQQDKGYLIAVDKWTGLKRGGGGREIVSRVKGEEGN